MAVPHMQLLKGTSQEAYSTRGTAEHVGFAGGQCCCMCCALSLRFRGTAEHPSLQVCVSLSLKLASRSTSGENCVCVWQECSVAGVAATWYVLCLQFMVCSCLCSLAQLLLPKGVGCC
jgi:hypothetical protein